MYPNYNFFSRLNFFFIDYHVTDYEGSLSVECPHIVVNLNQQLNTFYVF